jgi:L-rhamnose mutarotase
MERVCFLGQVRAERLEEYRERHERIEEIFHLD